MGEIGSFSWRVIDVIQKLIADRKITDAEVILRSGVPRNTFYRKMRGETSLTTDDIERLASALDVDPFAILHAASAQNITPIRRDVPALVQDERAVAKKKSRDRGGDDGQG